MDQEPTRSSNRNNNNITHNTRIRSHSNSTSNSKLPMLPTLTLLVPLYQHPLTQLKARPLLESPGPLQMRVQPTP
jgi:hypothetical protein